MGIKDVFSQAPSPEEEALYKQVLDEIESGIRRKGIYAKALADSLGDVLKAESLYIRYRVQSLVDEKKAEAKSIAYKNKQAKIAEKEKRERETLIDRKTLIDRQIRNKKIFTLVLFLIGVAVLIFVLMAIYTVKKYS